MAYYDALKAAWAGLSGTTAEKLAAINSQTVAGPNVEVPVSVVVGYLALAGKLSGLLAYAASAPATEAGVAAKELAALIGSPNAPAFAMGNPQTAATVTAFLGALVGDPASGLTSADQTAILALAATTRPWWQASGYGGPFNPNDLEAAELS